MNSKERGYIFQDAFTSYVIFREIYELLCGNEVLTEVVLDKKKNDYDKFDDLKIINNDNIKEIQIKYRETKTILDLNDFLNYSGDFNIYQFVKSYKNNKDSELCLIISLKEINISDELSKWITKIDGKSIFKDSSMYKFNINKEIIGLFFEKRISKNPKSKIDYSDLSKEDISSFLENFTFEITNNSVVDNSIKEVVIEQIENTIGDISSIPKTVIYKDMLETIREYRAEDDYKKIRIAEIAEKWLNNIKLFNYTVPINNELIIDKDKYISRKKDIEIVLEMLKATNLLHVYGAPGVGKSWFSKEFSDYLESINIKNSSYYFYFNLEDEEAENRLNKYCFITTFNYNLQKVHGYNINLFNLKMDDLTLIDDAQEHYIIIDGLDHIVRESSTSNIQLNELLNEIIMFSNNNPQIKIIVLSQVLDNMPIKNRYELGNLNKLQVQDLVKLYSENYNFDLADLCKIDFFEKSSGNPLLLKYMLIDYIINGNVFEKNITNLNEYYDLIFKGQQFHIYLYFSLIKFPISINELHEISSVSESEIEKEFKCIINVLLKNEKNEYIIFHESLRRYILELEKVNIDKLLYDILQWFKAKDLYMDSKKFNYYPSLVLEKNKVEEYNEFFDYEKIKLAIINNGYSENEVYNFISNNYKIHQIKEDFQMLYYLEHFYDIYSTFIYDFDINIFENYIYMLFYLGKYDLIRKLIYSKRFSKYSNFQQQWEYMQKIIVFLLRNKFEMNYEEIINQYFNNCEKSKILKINGLNIINSPSSIILIFEYLKYKNISDLSLVNNNMDVNSNIYKIVDDLLKRKCDNYIKIFYEKNILIPITKKYSSEELNNIICEETYISSTKNLLLLINYVFNNDLQTINTIISSWDDYFLEVPLVYKFICEFIQLLIKDNSNDEDFNKIFNNYDFNKLNFEGYISTYSNDELNFLGRLIVLSNNKDFIIEKFMEFKQKILNERSAKKYHDGIVSLLGTIYSQIISNVKQYSVILSENCLKSLLITNEYQQSNVSEFENNLTNYILGLISGFNFEIYFDNIINYMFSYGSYRDIQIWELKDILHKLISSNQINLYKFMQLVIISYNAIDRMDRAKDVWFIPNELIKIYSEKVSAIDAMNVFFSSLEMLDFSIRDCDELFYSLYDNINTKESRKLKVIYNYWKFMNMNIDYQFSNNETPLKTCIKFSNKREYYFIKNNILEILKTNHSNLNYSMIEENFKKKKNILKYVEIPSELNTYDSTKYYTDSLKYNSFVEMVNDINEKHIDCRAIQYENFIANLKKLDNPQIIYDSFIKIENSYELNYIYNVLNNNNFNYDSLNSDIVVELLVGLYYKSLGNVSNMYYDEIYEKALEISPIKAKKILKKYIVNDSNPNIGRKSGKFYKYLLEDNELENVYKNVINIYFSRLPNYKIFNKIWDISTFDKNDILLNYFLIKLMYSKRNNNLSIINEVILIKLFELKKFNLNKIVYMENSDGNSIKYLLEFLKMYKNILRLNYQGFMNCCVINEKNILKFEMNISRTAIEEVVGTRINNELRSILIPNFRGVAIIESDKVYKYNANLIQDYGEGLADRNLKYRILEISKCNFVNYLKNKIETKILMKIYFWKIKRIIKKTYINFGNTLFIYRCNK